MYFSYANHLFGLAQIFIIVERLNIKSLIVISPFEYCELSRKHKEYIVEKKLDVRFIKIRFISHTFNQGKFFLKELLQVNNIVNHKQLRPKLITPYNYGKTFEIIASVLNIHWDDVVLYDDGIGNLVLIENKFLMLKKIICLLRGSWKYRPKKYRLAGDERQKEIYTIYPVNAYKQNTSASIYDISAQVKKILFQFKQESPASNFVLILPSNESTFRVAPEEHFKKWITIAEQAENKYNMPSFIKWKWDDRVLSTFNLVKDKMLPVNINPEFYLFNRNCKRIISPINSTLCVVKKFDLDISVDIVEYTPHSHKTEKEREYYKLCDSASPD